MWVSERLRGGAYSETDTDSVAPGKVPEGGKAISWKSFEVSRGFDTHPVKTESVGRKRVLHGARQGVVAA